MKNTFTIILFALIASAIVLVSCENEKVDPTGELPLEFSVDTVMFDTVFTSIGSATKSFKVYNPNNQSITISSIQLANLDQSFYRLNIDGEMSNVVKDVAIHPYDSIFIFVELTIDPNGVNQPMIVQDSVVFSMNSKVQDVDLVAWGQDFIPINGEIITTTTWTAEKPYLVYNGALIDSGQVLTIEPGAHIHFHKNSFLIGKGAIIAQGTPEKPIIFQGDRLETEYFDIPDQWDQILILPNETPSIFENVEIYNAELGLQIGAIEYEGRANALIKNVTISHMGFIGLIAINSNIEASNLLITDCGLYALLIQAGGNYTFNHCTVGNFWGNYSTRKTPSVAIANNLYNPSTQIEYVGDLQQATWTNSIIWGNMVSELNLHKNPNAEFNCKFENCIVMVTDSLFKAEPIVFKNAFREDPKFIEPYAYNFQLDTLSPAKDAGLLKYGELLPFDLNNVSRLDDKAPDLGAYERIEKK